MPGILAPILRPLRRWATSHGDGYRPTARVPDRQLARRLADAVDRAMALGLWEHADRLAKVASQLAPGYARLSEPLARLRLAQGDPETALAIIDGCRSPATGMPSSLRLLRATCLLCLGSRTDAQLDLHRWSPRSSAPLDARLLLALLEWQDRDDAAIETLQRNLRHLEDPRTLQALLLIAMQRGRKAQTELWADRLRSCGAAGGIPDVDLMLRSLGMTGVVPDAEPTPEQVNALTMELITFEPAIAALTEAQRRRPHLPTARLIRNALEQALPDLGDVAGAYLALARLSLLLGDTDAARDFARRGLAEHPMSASLALLLRQLSGADAVVAEPADDAILATIGAKRGAPDEPARREKAA